MLRRASPASGDKPSAFIFAWENFLVVLKRAIGALGLINENRSVSKKKKEKKRTRSSDVHLGESNSQAKFVFVRRPGLVLTPKCNATTEIQCLAHCIGT